jgi:tripartite ATP-independent transporter DctM subunit
MEVEMHAELGVTEAPVGSDDRRVGLLVRRLLDRAVGALVVAALAGEVAIIFVGTVSREFFDHSFLWTQETATLSLSVIAFVGGALAYKEGQSLSIEAFVRLLPPRTRAAVRSFGDALVLLIAALVAVYAYDATRRDWSQLSTDLRLPLGAYNLPVCLGAVLICLYAVEHLWRRRSVSTVLLVTAPLAAAVAAILTEPHWSDWSLRNASSWTHYFWIGLVVMAVLFALGISIPFVLLIVPVTYFFVSHQVPTLVVEQQMVDSISSFLLLAIPFFVLAGIIMAEGGLGSRIAELVKLSVGRLPGGLQHAVILFMFVFSGLSGSKVADMAAVGATLGPELEQAGHRREDSTAVLAASAIMGETIPPSIALIVMGSITTSFSIGALFIAGVIPAVLLALFLALAVIFLHRGERGAEFRLERVGWAEKGRVLVRGIPALGLPVLLVYAIVGGVATPTEASSFAVVYGIVLAALYRKLTFRGLFASTRQAAVMSGMILFIISTAAGFSWFLNIEGFPTTLAKLLGEDLGYRTWAFSLASVGLLVVTGAFLEGLAAILIFGPLLLPTAIGLGIDPLQYGIVLVASMNLGFFTPPVGVGAYVACSIGGVSIERFIRPFAPYWVAMLVGILAFSLIEWPSTWLPNLFHLH